MMEYGEIYKCRMCGQKFVHNKVRADVVRDGGDGFSRADHRPYQELFVLHHCFGGDVGFADFIGYELISEDDDDNTE